MVSSAIPTATLPMDRTALDMTAASCPVTSSMHVVASARRSVRRIPSGRRILPWLVPGVQGGARFRWEAGGEPQQGGGRGDVAVSDEEGVTPPAAGQALSAEAVLFPVGEGPFTGPEDLDADGGPGGVLEQCGEGLGGGVEPCGEYGGDVLGAESLVQGRDQHGRMVTMGPGCAVDLISLTVRA